jgi:hypothetical protein
VKRVAFEPQSFGSSVQESGIKVGVVAHQNRAITLTRLDRLPYDGKKFAKGDVLRHCATQGVLWINAGELQRRRVKVCAFKGLNVSTVRLGDL